ncbi:bifunctional folylpolyglutamate synthase/dihydrofolate synthase, partial [bacterium]|nr:bifunctional folylpolyglutamate synthase/dihydrofolate synthase [bacterium]
KDTFSENKKIIDLGLNRILKVLDYFENPENSFKSIHLAGTNGKGSTSNIIQKILMSAFPDKKIGLYTSPHLFSYTERIKINDKEISDSDFLRLKKTIENACNTLKTELTEFEILTVLGFLYFKEQNVEIGIIETGLGGRLDATNSIKKPEIAVITSISKDHTERLGETIELVAKEKAGIIKSGSKVVVSPLNAGFDVIQKTSEEKGAELILANKNIEISFENNKNFAIINNEKYSFGLLGDFQAENLNLALTVVENLPFKIEKNAIIKGLREVSWKFRMELKDNVLIDGCHNPDGARVLREFLDKNFKNYKKRFIWSSLAHKDWQSVVKTLIKEDDELLFYHFNYPNSLIFEEIKKIAPKAIEISNPKKEIKNSKDNTLTIVCGSLYMLGEIFKP